MKDCPGPDQRPAVPPGIASLPSPALWNPSGFHLGHAGSAPALPDVMEAAEMTQNDPGGDYASCVAAIWFTPDLPGSQDYHLYSQTMGWGLPNISQREACQYFSPKFGNAAKNMSNHQFPPEYYIKVSSAPLAPSDLRIWV